MLPASTPVTGVSLTFSTVACTATSAESVLGNGRSVVTSGSFTTTGPVAERKTFCQMPVSRSRIAGIQSQPIVERKVGPSIAVMPPFFPMPARSVCSCGSPGCGSGVTSTATTALLARLHVGRDVEDAADKRSAHRAHLRAVHPHRRRVVDAVEVQPDVLAGIGFWESRPASCTNTTSAPGSPESPRAGCSRHRAARDRRDCSPESSAPCPEPWPCTTRRREAQSRNLRAGLRHLGHILQLPAGGQHNRLGRL